MLVCQAGCSPRSPAITRSLVVGRYSASTDRAVDKSPVPHLQPFLSCSKHETPKTKMEPVLLNSRGFADRLHILLSEKVVSESFQNVDISLLVHFALTKSLPGVKQLCDAGIPDGSVPPGLTGGHMKHIASVIYSLSQECVCCLVFFLKGIIMSSCPSYSRPCSWY